VQFTRAQGVKGGLSVCGWSKSMCARMCVACRYEVQDLTVIDILPQMVALSESYFQVYELRRGTASNGSAVAAAAIEALPGAGSVAQQAAG
jgi:hypothetical protein